jgi:hypothetical protein
MDSDRKIEQAQSDDAQEETRVFDASGTAHAASARENLEDLGEAAHPDAAALGLTGLMGQSESSPGLGGDLSPDDE